MCIVVSVLKIDFSNPSLECNLLQEKLALRKGQE